MTGLVILAAGESSRLGEPKQKVIYEGKSLLQRALETAVQSSCQPVILVLGAYANEIKAEIKDDPFIIFQNDEWREGMASSIRSGIEILIKKEPEMLAVILMVCDQPFVNTTLLEDMINKQAATGKGIIACSYDETLGVPVLFDKKFFPELLSLKGQEGAKRLIMKHKEQVAQVPFSYGSIDIDTVKDYNALFKSVPK